ncbi:unnamed protein product, partial [Ectocarpus sp. 12 AP-2014]
GDGGTRQSRPGSFFFVALDELLSSLTSGFLLKGKSVFCTWLQFWKTVKLAGWRDFCLAVESPCVAPNTSDVPSQLLFFWLVSIGLHINAKRLWIFMMLFPPPLAPASLTHTRFPPYLLLRRSVSAHLFYPAFSISQSRFFADIT